MIGLLFVDCMENFHCGKLYMEYSHEIILTGGLASSYTPSQTTGVALQLQLELQWHKEVLY